MNVLTAKRSNDLIDDSSDEEKVTYSTDGGSRYEEHEESEESEESVIKKKKTIAIDQNESVVASSCSVLNPELYSKLIDIVNPLSERLELDLQNYKFVINSKVGVLEFVEPRDRNVKPEHYNFIFYHELNSESNTLRVLIFTLITTSVNLAWCYWPAITTSMHGLVELIMQASFYISHMYF